MVTKTHIGIVVTRDGEQLKKLLFGIDSCRANRLGCD